MWADILHRHITERKGNIFEHVSLRKVGTVRYKQEEILKIFQEEHIIRIKVGKYLNNSQHLDKICEICSLLERNPDHI